MFNFPKDTTAALIESTELVMKLQDEIARLREELAALQNTWLSPEAYETLMQERQETLHELAAAQLDAARWHFVVTLARNNQAGTAIVIAPFGADPKDNLNLWADSGVAAMKEVGHE